MWHTATLFFPEFMVHPEKLLFMGGSHVRQKDKKRHYTPANKRKTFFHLPLKSMSIRGRQRDNTAKFMRLMVFSKAGCGHGTL